MTTLSPPEGGSRIPPEHGPSTSRRVVIGVLVLAFLLVLGVGLMLLLRRQSGPAGAGLSGQPRPERGGHHPGAYPVTGDLGTGHVGRAADVRGRARGRGDGRVADGGVRRPLRQPGRGGPGFRGVVRRTVATGRALLTDGTTVTLRRLGPGDRAAVARLHDELPLDDHYLRFFTGSRAGDGGVTDRVVANDVVAVGAWRGEQLLGVAHYRIEPEGTDPEIAMVVAHPDQGHGVASLLLEQLVAVAREQDVTGLSAEVLAVNHRMMRVLRDSGLPLTSVPDGSVRHLVLLVPPAHGDTRADHYLDAVGIK